MCGRYSLATTNDKITAELGVQSPIQLEISFNIAPTQSAYVISSVDTSKLTKMQWGLIPNWTKKSNQINGQLINARSESVFDKPSFKEAIIHRRCLIPADSFYEWRKEADGRKPFRILAIDGSLLVFAGIWETWLDQGEELHTFSILTCPANSDLTDLHNRMPVILTTPKARQDWLSNLTKSEIEKKLQTPQSGYLRKYAISRTMNSPAFNQPAVHQPENNTPTLF